MNANPIGHRDGDGAGPEQVQRHHRVRPAPLGATNEQPGRRDGHGEGGHHAGASANPSAPASIAP